MRWIELLVAIASIILSVGKGAMQNADFDHGWNAVYWRLPDANSDGAGS
jgi:hypothetical protein